MTCVFVARCHCYGIRPFLRIITIAFACLSAACRLTRYYCSFPLRGEEAESELKLAELVAETMATELKWDLKGCPRRRRGYAPAPPQWRGRAVRRRKREEEEEEEAHTHTPDTRSKPVVRRSLFLVFCTCWESSRSQGTSG